MKSSMVRWPQQQELQAGSLRTAFGSDDGEAAAEAAGLAGAPDQLVAG